MAGATSFIELILKKLGDDAAKVAVPAAGLMAAGQSEDADAGFITKGGKTLLEAWHGSPHKFDKFSMDQIGTGEGAQAYGHGLYFADSEDVARQYRDNLSALQGGLDGSANFSDNPVDSTAWMLNSGVDESGVREAIGVLDYKGDVDELIEAAKGRLKQAKSGALYRTEIDVTPESLLDWDKPLSEQSEAVRSAIESLDPLTRGLHQYAGEERAGRDFYWGLQAPFKSRSDAESFGISKEDYWLPDGERASKMLREAGVPGIKYLDGDSRAAGNGTSNYVIFDDSLINIAERGNAKVPMLAITAGLSGAGMLAPLVVNGEFQHNATKKPKTTKKEKKEKKEEKGMLSELSDALASLSWLSDKKARLIASMLMSDQLQKGLDHAEMPARGIWGTGRALAGVASGEKPSDTRLAANRIYTQPTDKTLQEAGQYVLRKTGSPTAAAATSTLGMLTDPTFWL